MPSSQSQTQKEDNIADQVIVLDNGTGHLKAGLADKDQPSVVMPTVVARPKLRQTMGGMGGMSQAIIAATDSGGGGASSGNNNSSSKTKKNQNVFVGSDAIAKRGVCEFSFPLSHGIVSDWDGLETVWRHCFYNELRVDPSDHPVVLTEAPLNPKKNREKMVEMLFDIFEVPACYVVTQAVMSLYAMGRTTGLVVDSGDGVTHFVPIYEGFSFPHCVKRLDLAGRDLTEYLGVLMQKRGFTFTSSSEKDILGEIKEKLCYCALSLSEAKKMAEVDGDHEKLFEMPDGRVVTCSEERFMVPECLFSPALIGRDIFCGSELEDGI